MILERFTPHPNPRPLRVALFSGNYNYTVDGANRALNKLVDHLERSAGAQVRVYSPTSPTPAFPPVGELISVPSVTIPSRRDYRIALGLPSRTRRDIETFAPDIIHLSAPDLLGWEALKLARRLDIPAVASLHTLFDTYLDYYSLGWLRPFLQRRLEAFYSGCDYVLAPTQAIADRLEREACAAQVRIWARGVDGELFNPARRCEVWRRSHGFNGERPVVVFFGRVVMEKGLAVFSDTVRQLERDRGPIPVLVIGDGPALPWFKERLPNAIFTGFLSGEPLARAVASGDILLNPSSTETFGNVNLEAMASGLVLVCADAPNTRALLRHGRSGLICAPTDVQAYVNAVDLLMQQPSERLQLGRAAHQQSALYRWPEILEGVGAVYHEALSRRQPGRWPETPRAAAARQGSSRRLAV